MARPLIASKLISSVRNRSFIPTDTSVFQDSDILDILNEEITQGLLSTIMTLNEEHMVEHIDIPITSADNLREGIEIPERAVGNKLRDVAFVSDSGSVYELSRISLEEVSDYDQGYDYYTFGLDVFYIEGNRVKFLTNKSSSGNVRMYFYMMPNSLVKEDECAKILSSTVDDDAGTTTITFSNFPDNFTNLPVMDFVSNKVPNKITGYDITPIGANKSQKTITFTTTDIPTFSTGEYVCEQFTTPFLNMPTEMHPLLAQRASVFILEALGDSEGLKNAMTRLSMMETSIQNILEDRVEGAPQKINARHSTLQQTSRVGTRGKFKGGR